MLCKAVYGTGREYDDFLCLTYGAGVGCGIMVQPLIMELIRKKVDKHLLPSFAHVDIRPGELGNSAGVLSAYHLALERMK